MKKFIVGNQVSDGKPVEVDIATLIVTRLLILSNSGGGKSFLIRRLAEQLCHTMPVIIIDPEGEFSTLREKFDFFLVGKGGDAPADVRTAKLVMHKFLELRASVVFDLSEMPIEQRHLYVKLISEAAIDSPKEFWNPTAFIFDEVQLFAPENGKGESIAKNAVIAFPTRGRKRQFLSIFGTQRPAKLAMDARAEFQNRMIGGMFEMDDLKVAAATLGISGKQETTDFNHKMRTMLAGNFFAFGRAISTQTILLKVGGIETSHGVGKSKKFATSAPPAPDKIKAMLPSLADLPKEAEEKEQSEKQMRDTIAGLRAELKTAKAAQPTAAKIQRMDVPALTDGERKRITTLAVKFKDFTHALKMMTERIGKFVELKDQMSGEVSSLKKIIEGKLTIEKPIEQIKHMVFQHWEHGITPISTPPIEKVVAIHTPDGEWKPDKMARAILGVLSQFQSGCNIQKIALLARYAISGGFRNALADLRKNGAIIGKNTGTMASTELGMKLASGTPQLPTGAELIQLWKDHPSFQAMHRAIIDVLASMAQGGYTIEQIAAGCHPPYAISGGFRNALADLRMAGIMIGKNTGRMGLNPEMFL